MADTRSRVLFVGIGDAFSSSPVISFDIECNLDLIWPATWVELLFRLTTLEEILADGCPESEPFTSQPLSLLDGLGWDDVGHHLSQLTFSRIAVTDDFLPSVRECLEQRALRGVPGPKSISLSCWTDSREQGTSLEELSTESCEFHHTPPNDRVPLAHSSALGLQLGW